MLRFFNQLFNIRTEEWPRVLLLFAVVTLLSAADMWGTIIAYTAFLQQIGIRALPWILAFSSGLSILAIAIYTAFVDRINNHRLLMVLYVASFASIGLGLVLLWLNLPSIAYPVMYLLFLVRVAVSDPHFITYVNSFYNIQSAKRILPIVSAGFRTGVIVAGLTMPFLTTWFTPSIIIVIWFLMYIPIIGLLGFMPYFLKEGDTHREQPVHTSPTTGSDLAKQSPSYVENMWEGLQYTIQSTYLRWMAMGTLLLMVLIALIEYKSTELLLGIYGRQEELASFLAILNGLGNIVVLPMLLFMISRIITRLGLGNASLIFPIGNLMACSGLIFVPGLFSAAAAYFDRTAFLISFQYPIDGLLYNAVPLKVKGRARAFVGGLIEPIGTLTGSLLLLLPFVSIFWWFVPTLIGVLAGAYGVSALFIRRQYSQALIKMLEQEDYSFLLSQEASSLTVADPAMLNQLKKRLEESPSHEFTIFMAQLIAQVGGSNAIPILGQAARSTPDVHTRTAILDILRAADIHSDKVRQLYTNFLDDPDGGVRQSAFAGLEQLSDPGDKQFQTLALEMLTDPDIDVQVRSLSALAKSGNFYNFPPAIELLSQLLNNEDPQRKAQGIRVLGEIYTSEDAVIALQLLVEYLSAPEDEVRLEAAMAIERASALEPTKRAFSHLDATLITEWMIDLLQDPVERVRQIAIIVLGRVGGRAVDAMLINTLKDSSPQVRATAVDTLVQKGRSIIPVIYPQLNSSEPQLRQMTTVVLGRINPQEFGSLIGKHITENLLVIYRNYGYLEALAPCTGYRSIPILQSTLREQKQRLIDEIFYLLTAIHDSSAVKIITDSLRSEDSHIRANAAEALETLTTPQTAQLITPLFEPEFPSTQLLALSARIWDMEPPNMLQTFQQLATKHDDLWMRTLIIFVLGEIAAVLASKITQSGYNPIADTRRRQEAMPSSNFETLVDDTLRVIFSLLIDGSHPRTYFMSDEGEKKTSPSIPDLQSLFTLPEVEILVDICFTTGLGDEIQQAAKAARRIITIEEKPLSPKERVVLSTIEKIIFLKEVPFFQGMTIEQLKVLANVCEEVFFPKDTYLFNQGDPGGILYVIVNGRVGIDQEKRKGSFVRVNTHGPASYLGEVTLFDKGPRTASGIAIQDTLALRLRREPLLALARQYPDLSLELINALNRRLRETYDRIATLTRSRPRELHKLFDQFE